MFIAEINLIHLILYILSVFISISDATSINCYLHNNLPVKTASKSNKKYFNCVVECSDKSVRAVCYSPEKRGELHALTSTGSPVKLDNYKPPNNGDDDLVITRFTKHHTNRYEGNQLFLLRTIHNHCN